MNSELYYCKPWDYVAIHAGRKEYDVCVSPAISGNAEGSIIQFHGAVFVNGQVVRLGMLSSRSTSCELRQLISELERGIRDVMRTHLVWNEELADSGVVKVWYFEEDGNSRSSFDKVDRLPLRFAVTAINITAVNEADCATIHKALENTLVSWLKTQAMGAN